MDQDGPRTEHITSQRTGNSPFPCTFGSLSASTWPKDSPSLSCSATLLFVYSSFASLLLFHSHANHLQEEPTACLLLGVPCLCTYFGQQGFWLTDETQSHFDSLIPYICTWTGREVWHRNICSSWIVKECGCGYTLCFMHAGTYLQMPQPVPGAGYGTPMIFYICDAFLCSDNMVYSWFKQPSFPSSSSLL